MKTTVKFNKGNERVNVTDYEVAKRTTNQELKDYIELRLEYSNFCNNQTKTGQARKNERARARKSIFSNLNTDLLDNELMRIRDEIKNEKDSLIEKIEVEIEYDGRKASNLSKIIQGVRMAIFVGGISPQYYGIGLVDFKVKK